MTPRFMPGFCHLLLPAFAALVFWGSPVLAASSDECLRDALNRGADSLTLGEIRATCQDKQIPLAGNDMEGRPGTNEDSLWDNSVPKTYADRFSVSPHKQNYILLYSHNTAPNTTPYQNGAESAVDHDEITFQVSLKFPLGSFRLGAKKTYILAAYTAQSFWQAYNKTLSSPFRETNHEPEVFAVYPLDLDLPAVRRAYLMAGFVHQSNGRSQPLSRSWNRLYVDFVVEGDNFKISLKPWYRIPEEDKVYLGASEGDDNPDINEYLGYGEFSGAFKLADHTLSFMLRNNLDFHDNKGAIKLGWSFKIPYIEADNLRGYIHYFNGYGESLIDYNAAVERIGVGFMLADWL